MMPSQSAIWLSLAVLWAALANPAPALAQTTAPAQKAPEIQQGEAVAGFPDHVARHRDWLRSLGDPALFDAMGLIFLSPEQRRDPLRLRIEGADLRGLRARNAPLTGSVLSGSRLDGADLRGARLDHAVLERARLTRARLDEANLKGAKMDGAHLSGANLFRADLRNSQLSGADLRGANLTGADLSGSILVGADLSQAILSKANFSNADFSQARLPGADLHQTVLHGAQLFNADLSRARLRETDFSDAQLYGADLFQAVLIDADFQGAGLGNTNLGGTNLFANRLEGAALEDIDLAGVVFEPPLERLKWLEEQIGSLVKAKNLGLMTFFADSEPLELLMRMLKQNDYPRQTLEVTYALRRGLRRKASSEGTLWERTVSYVQLVFVELPIEYGAAPLRPILIVLALIGLFGTLYLLPLYRPSRRFGEIWRITPREQFGRFSDGSFKEPLRATRPGEALLAYWFSFLSAVNIGGRIFNLDDLFINCQPYEFHLRGTGWVRMCSGLQALSTLYMIMLTLLIYFEKVTF